MRINYFSYRTLQDTGNEKLNQKIRFLIEMAGGNIMNLINRRGNVECGKVDNLVSRIINNCPVEIRVAIEETLKDVRKTLKENFELNYLLKNKDSLEECVDEIRLRENSTITNITLNILLDKCKSIEECENVIRDFGKGVTLNVISLNTMIKKCKSLQEYRYIKEKYFKEIELNLISYTSLLMILIENDDETGKKELKEEIKIVLKTINSFDLDDGTKNILKNICKPFINFIRGNIKHLKLQNLAFLLGE